MRVPLLKSLLSSLKSSNSWNQEVYRLEITRTLTPEELTALWVAFSHNKVMTRTTYDMLPQSLRDMAHKEVLK